MRAIVITEPGGPEVLQIQEVADPVPADGGGAYPGHGIRRQPCGDAYAQG